LKYKPQYAKSAVYYQVVGSAAFMAGRYSQAAESYRRSLAIDSADVHIRAWLVDALLFAGKYREAADEIELIARSMDIDSLTVVNEVVVREVMAVTGLREQSRRDITANEIKRVEKEPRLAEEMLRSIDALEPGLWLARSLVSGELSHKQVVLLARLYVREPSLWVEATIRAYFESGITSRLFSSIVSVALDNCSDSYLDLLTKEARKLASRHFHNIEGYAHKEAISRRDSPPKLALIGADDLT
jgi:tetratricopeptide (TPR) repeat protein